MAAKRQVIYMDHAATTPVHPAVVAAMEPYFQEFYGNPSSIHGAGRRASVALEAARRTVADYIHASPKEIIFTSGGTEGDNSALRGIALAQRAATGANRIVTTAVEHHAVLHTAFDLRDHFGFALSVLPVDAEGRVQVESVREALGDGADVAVVSVMLANNEIGAIQPVAEVGALCRAHEIPLHTDAVQAVSMMPLDVNTLGVAALSTSGHKFYGPKGVGFLYLRSGTPFLPILTGGSHEGNRRAGTENVPLIVGMAKALELVAADLTTERTRLRLLRDQLIGGILEAIDGARLTGPRVERLENLASFVIAGVEAEGVLIGLDLAGVAASSGSACTSGAQRPSHVLEAMGITGKDALGALRLSLGHSNTAEDVQYVLDKLPAIVRQIRSAVPVIF
ncbi:MAG: cysteine desulfurase family protein [Caldilineaceae bacterium]